jgi:surfactin synthase thioesterase subunit
LSTVSVSFATIEGGHFLLQERPAAVAEQLTAFARNVRRGTGVTLDPEHRARCWIG